MKETYTMKAICKNCDESHNVKIPLGHRAFTHKTKCPYCDCDGCGGIGGTFEYRRKK